MEDVRSKSYRQAESEYRRLDLSKSLEPQPSMLLYSEGPELGDSERGARSGRAEAGASYDAEHDLV